MASRVLLLWLAAASFSAWGTQVAEIKFDEKAKVADADLALAGAGLRKRLFFQVYAIGLYVQDPKADPIAQPGPKRVRIHMLRDVSAEQFTEALVDGINANHTEAQAKALEPQVKQLAATVAAIGEAKAGTVITLDWNGSATVLAAGGQPAGVPIPGETFYRALLRIWLGDNPVQDDLQKALAGN